MAKKPINVTIRKASSAPPSEPAVRAGFRSVTLYLPDALVERLMSHARGQDLNVLVADVLEKHFANEQHKAIVEDDPVASLVKWVQGKFSRVASLRPAWLF
jgi:hypothetical protein